MKAELYFKMMETKVFPAIGRARWPAGTQVVVVQQDGARPHTGKQVVERLNEVGRTYSPRIEVRTQPAQSPDMNVNDLALFRALDVAVRKHRRGSGNRYDKEQLVADVQRMAAEYPSEKLDAMWEYKNYVMQAVVACNGGNDYERHRS